ncbi:hypothetical protein ACQJBY_051070 [Aegilops geniculata]
MAAAAALAEAGKWLAVLAKAVDEASHWASVAAKACESDEDADKRLSIASNAAAEAKKCAAVAAKAAAESKKWSSIAISERKSLAVMPPSQDKAGIRNGLKEEEEEELLVITNPKLASLIYHCFNIAFVLEVLFFMVHVVLYYNSTEVWWQALAAAVIVSPLVIMPLYFLPMLRDVFMRAYAMGDGTPQVSQQQNTVP